ncbi:hypothetical protein CCMSSC00406_0001732 [Pleurotus cornucopiae]|uniref:Uncharacterized protein n=1 Tax=Pleurotus cornucopiae TaxID=5321 RepID=A0ACB7IM95_PLECO|nr:hypothetical protein CCMSSC00406_0001732 [Pleurotus cornucopiae]
MATISTPNDSPNATPVQPLHNPKQAATVVVPKAPLGNVGNKAPGMGAKALLAKKMAKSHNPNFISPTDNMMTPCTQKLNAAKKKHFTKGAKPVQLFAQKEESNDEEMSDDSASKDKKSTDMDDGENPF